MTTGNSASHVPWFDKQGYRQIFTVPGEPWIVRSEWTESYFKASEEIVDDIVNGRRYPEVWAAVAVYLFRHYMELGLKYIVLHCRYLRDVNLNAQDEEIQKVKKTHSHRYLWDAAKRERVGRIDDDTWRSYDVDFIERCVAEFDRIDPQPGDRFRYFGSEFGGRPVQAPIYVIDIDFGAMLFDMRHVYEILEAIDNYLYETYTANADWNAFLKSL